MLPVTSQADLDKRLGSALKSVVVVNFYAQSFKPCLTIVPFLTDLSKKFEQVTFVQVDVDQAQGVTEKYRVTAIPTFLFFKNKIIIDCVKGADQVALEELLNKHAPRPGTIDNLVEKLKTQIETTFDSVNLPPETIDMIRSLVSLTLICPEAFQTGILKKYNMSGALLFGPPGTGKTHIARAIAKESGARMISIKPSNIRDKWVGESEKLISAVFQLARRLKPCIIFIDEIDGLFGARTSHSTSSWRTDQLVQFAQEMDGMIASDVVVIGTTNRPFDIDDAMIRRLPCRILFELPDEPARKAILGMLVSDEQLEEDVDLAALARQTSQFSGSDLKHLCVTAAYESAKDFAYVPWRTKKLVSGEQSSSACATKSELPTSATRKETSETCEKPEPTIQRPQVRKLSKQHFEHALTQVRASTSEAQASLRELRQWNDKFGSMHRGKAVVAKDATSGPAMTGRSKDAVAGNVAGNVASVSANTRYPRQLGDTPYLRQLKAGNWARMAS